MPKKNAYLPPRQQEYREEDGTYTDENGNSAITGGKVNYKFPRKIQGQYVHDKDGHLIYDNKKEFVEKLDEKGKKETKGKDGSEIEQIETKKDETKQEKEEKVNNDLKTTVQDYYFNNYANLDKALKKCGFDGGIEKYKQEYKQITDFSFNKNAFDLLDFSIKNYKPTSVYDGKLITHCQVSSNVISFNELENNEANALTRLHESGHLIDKGCNQRNWFTNKPIDSNRNRYFKDEQGNSFDIVCCDEFEQFKKQFVEKRSFNNEKYYNFKLNIIKDHYDVNTQRKIDFLKLNNVSNEDIKKYELYRQFQYEKQFNKYTQEYQKIEFELKEARDYFYKNENKIIKNEGIYYYVDYIEKHFEKEIGLQTELRIKKDNYLDDFAKQIGYNYDTNKEILNIAERIDDVENNFICLLEDHLTAITPHLEKKYLGNLTWYTHGYSYWHGNKYFNETKYGIYRYGMETFANTSRVFSSNKYSIDLAKKYLPKTYNTFEKNMIKYIKNGKFN